MWAKIITIKRTKDLNYFSLCALNLFNTRVSQFELNYWNKWTFPPHTNLLRCTCISFKDFKYITQGQFNCLSICIMLNRIQNWCSLHFFFFIVFILLNVSHITANEHNSSHSIISYRKNIEHRLHYVKYENIQQNYMIKKWIIIIMKKKVWDTNKIHFICLLIFNQVSNSR